MNSFAYLGYRDRVSIESIPTNSHYYRSYKVSGQKEDVFLAVADFLNQPVTPMYEHLAWKIREIETIQTGSVATISVTLFKSDYAGD